MAYATISDVEIDYGTVSIDQEERVETLLDRAEAILAQSFRWVGRDLNAAVTAGSAPLVTVKQVEAEMVAAVLRNPEGTSNTSTYETVGPFARQASKSFGAGAASGRLEVTDRHLGMLNVRPYRGPYLAPLRGSL